MSFTGFSKQRIRIIKSAVRERKRSEIGGNGTGTGNGDGGNIEGTTGIGPDNEPIESFENNRR